jgi:hypothetical protein
MAENSWQTKLPREIINVIIANTHDLTTLKHWAVVDKKSKVVAERILWQSIAIDIERTNNNWFLPPEGTTNPLWIIQKEQVQQENLACFRDPSGTNDPPLYYRNTLVTHILLKTNFEVSGQYPEDGIFEEMTIRMFPNLTSARIDGIANQLVWDTLLKLPALRSLRLWRISWQPEQLSSFHGVSRLQALQIGMLLPQEALGLGEAVRQSNLRVLHINSTDVYMTSQGGSVLANFFTGLAAASAENMEESDHGFPSSLVELAIEDHCHE